MRPSDAVGVTCLGGPLHGMARVVQYGAGVFPAYVEVAPVLSDSAAAPCVIPVTYRLRKVAVAMPAATLALEEGMDPVKARWLRDMMVPLHWWVAVAEGCDQVADEYLAVVNLLLLLTGRLATGGAYVTAHRILDPV